MASSKRVYGLGVDLVHVPRLRGTFARFGERFLLRAFHEKEIKEFQGLKSAEAQDLYLASRWAVKEATYKAFRRYRLLFPEIRLEKPVQVSGARASVSLQQQIEHLPQLIQHSSGGPRLTFCGKTQLLAQELALTDPLVSISHDHEYAIACVILQQRDDASNGPR